MMPQLLLKLSLHLQALPPGMHSLATLTPSIAQFTHALSQLKEIVARETLMAQLMWCIKRPPLGE